MAKYNESSKDPICGMKVNIKEAKKRGLTFGKNGKDFYFCNKFCKKKYLGAEESGKTPKKNNIPWYKSEIFGRWFPYFLGSVLIIGAIWSFLANFMLIYMGIFFIIFSLAKMPDWKGFVNAFSMYDLIASRFRLYAWIYPGIEFVLGLLYLFDYFILGAVWVTLIIMSIGAMGVGIKLIKKEKFQCACLGTKIGVPLTKITLLENIIMFVMALFLLV